MNLQTRDVLRWAVFSMPLIFLALFYFYPLIKIVLLSFFPEGSWQLGKLSKLVASPVYLRILWFTIWQAALSTVLTLLVALPGAYIFARYRFWGKNVLQAMMTVPFVLPTVVVAAAFRALLGGNGLLNDWLIGALNLSGPPIKLDQTVYFFLLAHVFYNYSLVVRIVSSYWAGLDPNLRSAARMLGASPWQTFCRVTLPLLLPAIGSAALLVFIFCFTSFGVVLILGGPGYATVEVEIYRQAVQMFNLPMAAALSLIQIAINFLLMWVYARLDRKSKSSLFADSAMDGGVRPETYFAKSMVITNISLMLLLLVTPLLALVLRSFTGEEGLTLAYYVALFFSSEHSVFFVQPITAVVNSVGFGAGAMILAVLLGLMASAFLASDGAVHVKPTKKTGNNGASNTLWDALIMLPLATSAVTLGFGYIITLNTPPLNLRDSLALVPIAHALVAFPFAVRCILPQLRQIPQSLREAATMLGASPAQVFLQVDFPIIRRAILVGAVFAFSISMGEFGASSFVTRPHTPTMPVAIFRFLGQPGEMNYGQAMAMSTILMLVACSGFWLISKFDRSRRIFR